MPRAIAPPVVDDSPLAGLRVLLVDDLPTNCLIAGEILEAFGATVDTAENGVQALRKLLDDQIPCDVVLMDIQMPEMDGLEATRRLRATLRGARLPIIAMTAHALDSERERCRAAGMDDFIAKPIDPEFLQQKLLRWRPAHAGKRASRTPEKTCMSSSGELPELPGIDKADGLRRMMNKPALYEKGLRDFHSRFLSEPEAIRAAIDSGDLAQAQKAYAPHAQLLIYPVLDFKSRHPSFYAYQDGLALTGQDVEQVTAYYAQQHQVALDDPLISPTYGRFEKLAPAYIVAAGHDALHDEAEIYAHKLRQQGVKVHYQEYADQTHGFINIFH